MDIGLKIGVGIAVSLGTASAVILPNQKQKDAAALEMYGSTFKELQPQQATAAEFKAGHARWKNFVEKSIYPITRAIPGNSTPIVHPYRNSTPPVQDADE
jgi:hypothetical protein